MLDKIVADPGTIAVTLLGSVLVLHLFLSVRYAYKLRRAGGVQAPALASNSISALPWLYRMGSAQYHNNLLGFIGEVFDKHETATCKNCAEINVLGNQRFVFTREPEHIKTLLTGKFADYGKGPEFHRVWRPFLGDSIFTTDHQQWQESRNLIRPMFVKNRVSDLQIFEDWTQTMMNKFPKAGETFDIQELFYRMTIDVITEFLLGEGVDSLNNPKNQFVEAFSSVQRWQMMFTALMPIEKLIPRGPYNKGIKVIEELITPYIERTLALSEDELAKLSKSDTSFTFLHALAGYTRDPQMIRDQLMAILIAGRDTTAATLSWAMYQLSAYPEIYAKLRKEILDVVGPDKAPSYEDLKRMKYLTHTLNETLRLYPAVPINIRYALTDTTIPSTVPGQPDITLVAGDAVAYSTLLMQRRVDIYPPVSPEFRHPKVFSPERWENWTPKTWQYVPFNGGPRICVGQNFAMTEMAYVLVRICQRYDKVEYRGDWNKQYEKVEIVGCPGQGVNIALHEAKAG